MRLAISVRIGASMLIGLNLLMALGAIWIFMRMAPAIKIIIEQNQRSLEAGEDMLASLAVSPGDTAADKKNQDMFTAALDRAKHNVTETQEPPVLRKIEATYFSAFQGDRAARRETVAGIVHLGKINREAMAQADRRAQQLGNAGAWGVVFMAACVFWAGIVFNRNLDRRVVMPLEEIGSAVAAYRNGDMMRRCSGANLSPELRAVYNGINEIIDRCQFEFHEKETPKNR